MKVSVIIPTYNSSAFIRAALESVLSQSCPPDEILLMDDGSTDDTVSILKSYGTRITLFQQKNQGSAPARNALCDRARGDLIAVLDHDDVWHPLYLETQQKLFQQHPEAVAFFTGHVNFYGYGGYEWTSSPVRPAEAVELIQPLDFLQRYNTTGLFMSMSYCCISKRALELMGCEPFRISGVEDSYLCNQLPLLGPVVYTPAALVAFRISDKSQSASRLATAARCVMVFEALRPAYDLVKHRKLKHAFLSAYAAKKRWYGKILMGAGRPVEARRQFSLAVMPCRHPVSLSKSLGLWLFTLLPRPLQPRWLPTARIPVQPAQNSNQ